MSRPFSQTLRSLDADSGRLGVVGALAAMALVAAWLVWFVGSDVTLWVSTDDASLEIDGLPHVVEAPVDAEVVETSLELGAEVAAGDVVLRLRTTEFETELRRIETRSTSLDEELSALATEMAVRSEILAQLRAGSVPRLDEAVAELESRKAAARNAAEDAERLAELFQQGQVSESEARRQRSEADQLERSVEALRQRVEVLRSETRLDQGEQRASLAELERDAAALRGSLADAEGEIESLRDEVELRTIRAPVSGRMAEVARLVPTSVVEAGDRLFTVVPEGDLRLRASFQVADALGRIRPGQTAVVRLDGFPWAQYGTLNAEVVRVGGEARDGRLDVLLDLKADSPDGVELVHGMTGRVEIAVEELSPAALVVRAAGQRLSGG